MDKVFVITGFDGSCPQSKEAIKQEDNATFTIFPSWRKEQGISEEEKGKGFRLGLDVKNDSNRAEQITLNIEWEDEERARMKYRDFVFIKGERDTEWHLTPALVKGTVSSVKLNLPPGKTAVCLNPRYNYTDNEHFVKRVSKNELIEKERAGVSEEKKNIWLLKVGKGETKVLIMARNHAYESAGNYCVEGMVDWLLSDDSLAKYFLSKFKFYLLPMTNPDGVCNGLSRLTSTRGADLNRVMTVPDKAHQTIKKVLDDVNPRLFINIHNWMDKFKDGLLCLNGEFARKITFYMPDQIEYGKKWHIEDWDEYIKSRQSPYIPNTSRSWKDYCDEYFGTVGLVYEFPWFGRNTKIMKETGVKALKAVLFAWMNR